MSVRGTGPLSGELPRRVMLTLSTGQGQTGAPSGALPMSDKQLEMGGEGSRTGVAGIK